MNSDTPKRIVPSVNNGIAPPPESTRRRQETILEIRKQLDAKGLSLQESIAQRDLYFRVSLLGTCNLTCTFCHNEGAPKQGKADITQTEKALRAAFDVGFRRVQFTGGEPLLHHGVVDFVRIASALYPDVGITTNGTFLFAKLPALLDAGMNRIHISLQSESLRTSAQSDTWTIPDWLEPILETSRNKSIRIRLNLPVPHNEISEASQFLKLMRQYDCSFKVFAILPEGDCRDLAYPLNDLIHIVDAENAERIHNAVPGQVEIRSFRRPDGIRCTQCSEISRCREQSHSLRLGADGILRPCLATRQWDSRIQNLDLDIQSAIRDAATLAIDFIR